MKKLKKLTLSNISKIQLDERNMSRILGGAYGDPCQCGCKYADTGGSSTSSNAAANEADGLNSGSCPEPYTEPAQQGRRGCDDYEGPEPTVSYCDPVLNSLCSNQPGVCSW